MRKRDGRSPCSRQSASSRSRQTVHDRLGLFLQRRKICALKIGKRPARDGKDLFGIGIGRLGQGSPEVLHEIRVARDSGFAQEERQPPRGGNGGAVAENPVRLATVSQELAEGSFHETSAQAGKRTEVPNETLSRTERTVRSRTE